MTTTKKKKEIDDLRFVYDNNCLDEKSENIILDLIEKSGGEINW